MGRGIRILFCAIALLAGALSDGFSAPQNHVSSIVPVPPTRPELHLLCQDTAQEAINYSAYFSIPEVKEDLVYVFYNTEIAVDDLVQAGYALLYGLQYAAIYARGDELLAVVIYFKNNKAKIYSIRKQVFEGLQNRKINPDDLMKYMKVEVKETE